MIKYNVSDDSVDHVWELGEGQAIRLLLRDLRRERTGIHGRAAIAFGGRILRYDTFNLSRAEERTKLCKGAHIALPKDIQELVGLPELSNAFDMICLYASNDWERDRVTIVAVDADAPTPPLVTLLPPHIIEGTGTIIFAPPGAGKSWLGDLICASLAGGLVTLWKGPRQTPTLYVDLERNELFFRRRVAQIRRALGQPLPPIPYLRGRGMGLVSLKSKIKEWVRGNAGGVVLYDSISRMGGGSLKDDDVANSLIDLANGVSDTWIALAHSPRDDAGHVFGSIHFDAGADTVIKLSSASRGPLLGCSLKVTKSNHLGGNLPVLTYQLEFDAHGLIGVRTADSAAWPELAGSLVDALLAALDVEPKGATVAELARGTKSPEGTVRYNLDHDARFARLPKTGKEVLYTLADRTHP